LLIQEDTDSGERGFWVTLRRARVHLVSPRGYARIENGNFVNAGHELGQEVMLVKKTADIVQGLPRVSRIFENNGDVYTHALCLKHDKFMALGMSNFEAALAARDELQLDLVGEVLSVYKSQGVTINSRHVEICVRRMTDLCKVTKVAGTMPSKLTVGSLVSYSRIEAIMAMSSDCQVLVQPQVRGITQVGKDTHVLVGMGFREVDNIMAQDIATGPPTHRMEGIKENLMVGKRISVGTNQRSGAASWQDEAEQEQDWHDMVELERIPEHVDNDAWLP